MSDDLDFDLAGALPFENGADADTPQKPTTTTLGIDFAYIGEAHTVESFAAYCAAYNFGTTLPDYVVLHHTAVPSTLAARYPSGAVWDANEAGLTIEQITAKRLAQLGKVRDYYRDVLGWDRGPHLWIDDRFIYLMTPMYDVGIHAAAGNSYRDRAGKLHYSIGIEVVGYYEHVAWPPPVARNVGLALAILRRRLGTFGLDYRPGPRNTPAAHVGSLSSHRDFNKIACPGGAITEAFYTEVAQAGWRALTGGDTPPLPPPHPSGDRHYRVLPTVTGGATIRSMPSTSGAILGRLHAGDDWYGLPEAGQQTYVKGFGSSATWVASLDRRFVWGGLLEEVKP